MDDPPPEKQPPAAEEVRAALKKQVRHPYITGQGLKREEPDPQEPAVPKGRGAGPCAPTAPR